MQRSLLSSSILAITFLVVFGAKQTMADAECFLCSNLIESGMPIGVSGPWYCCNPVPDSEPLECEQLNGRCGSVYEPDGYTCGTEIRWYSSHCQCACFSLVYQDADKIENKPVNYYTTTFLGCVSTFYGEQAICMCETTQIQWPPETENMDVCVPCEYVPEE